LAPEPAALASAWSLLPVVASLPSQARPHQPLKAPTPQPLAGLLLPTKGQGRA